MVPQSPNAKTDPGMAFAAILQRLADDSSRERVSFAEILGEMGERAFGPLLLVFALPNILPTPPGTAGIMAIPLIILTFQMVLAKRPWLPGFVARRSVSRETFARFVARITPLLARAERWLRPRLGLFLRPLPERLVGLICLVLSLVLLLPIPFANSAPAFAICLFGLGLLQRDGAWILAGMIASVGALLVASWLGYTLIAAAIAVAGRYLI